MRVKIITSNSAEQLEEKINTFLEKENLKNIALIEDIKYQAFAHPSGINNYSVMVIYE